VSAPDAVGPLASPGFWLHRAAMAYNRRLDGRLRPLGLTHTQFSLLAAASWLARDAEPPSQQEAAEFAGVDKMMTSKVLATLAGKGLVERVTDGRDARLRRVRATDEGRQVLREAVRAAQQVDAEFFAAVDADLRPGLNALVEPRAVRR
jgi:DNA-binding MarR family transcriptional regulator